MGQGGFDGHAEAGAEGGAGASHKRALDGSQASFRPTPPPNLRSQVSPPPTSIVSSQQAAPAPAVRPFDPLSFDATSAESWASFGEMLRLTQGFVPSQEQFLGMVGAWYQMQQGMGVGMGMGMGMVAGAGAGAGTGTLGAGEGEGQGQGQVGREGGWGARV